MSIWAPLDRLIQGPKGPPRRPRLYFEIAGQKRRFNPKPDITAYELAQVQIFLGAGLAYVGRTPPMDTAAWWQEVGPSVQRHFDEPKQQQNAKAGR